MCPFRQLILGHIEYKRHEENTSKIGQESIYYKSKPTTTVIGPLHECKKVCPCTKTLPQTGIRA